MKVLVTGSSSHLGEALVRTLRQMNMEVMGVDILPSAFTTQVGSIADPSFVQSCMAGVEKVFHTATLHKPHVATHDPQQFIDCNITGTLNLLRESAAADVKAFIFTSTTSTFGDALIPPPGNPAAWITEDVQPVPKNIYGSTKTAAEDLCQLWQRNAGLNVLVLRTSRFFPEADDNPAMRDAYADSNLKANEFLYRRVDIEDVVTAHLQAAERASDIGFAKYIISASTPFFPEHLKELRQHAPQIVKKLFPEYEGIYASRGWRMLPGIDRVYVNAKARNELGWQPKYDFSYILNLLKSGTEDLRSPMARLIGSKGYHASPLSSASFPR